MKLSPVWVILFLLVWATPIPAGTPSEPEIQDPTGDVSPPMPTAEHVDILAAWIEPGNRSFFRIHLQVEALEDTTLQGEYWVHGRQANRFNESAWKRPIGVRASGNALGNSFEIVCAWQLDDDTETDMRSCAADGSANINGFVTAGSPGLITWEVPRLFGVAWFPHGWRFESLQAQALDRSVASQDLVPIGDTATGGPAFFDWVDYGFVAFPAFEEPAGGAQWKDEKGDVPPPADLTGLWVNAQAERLEFIFRLAELNRTGFPDCPLFVRGELSEREGKGERVEASLRVELRAGVPRTETRLDFRKLGQRVDDENGSAAHSISVNGTASMIEGTPGYVRLRFENATDWTAGPYSDRRHTVGATTLCIADGYASDAINVYGQDGIPSISASVMIFALGIGILILRRRGPRGTPLLTPRSPR